MKQISILLFGILLSTVVIAQEKTNSNDENGKKPVNKSVQKPAAKQIEAIKTKHAEIGKITPVKIDAATIEKKNAVRRDNEDK